MRIIRELAKEIAKEIVYEMDRLKFMYYVKETKNDIKETLDGIEEKSRYNRVNRANKREFKKEIERQEKVLAKEADFLTAEIRSMVTNAKKYDDFSIERHIRYNEKNGFPYMDIRLEEKATNDVVKIRLRVEDGTRVRVNVDAII